MPHEVINIRPNPRGGHGLSEAVALEIAKTYDRVVAAGGRIVASHALNIPQYPQITQELFLIAELPEGTSTDGYVSIPVEPNSQLQS